MAHRKEDEEGDAINFRTGISFVTAALHPIVDWNCWSKLVPSVTWLLIKAITVLQTHNKITFDVITTKTHYFLDRHDNVPLVIILLRQVLNERINSRIMAIFCSLLDAEINPVKSLLVHFEKLTDDVIGAAATARIADFLSQSECVHTCPPELIPCV